MAKKPRNTEGNGSAPAEGTEAPASANSITIQGITFEAPAPYAEGHVMNAAEAATLNQTLSENLRNNFAGAVKKAVEEAQKAGSEVDAAALQAKFAEYANSYEFHGRRATRAPADPVQRTAEKLAKEAILAAMRKNKIDTKSVSAEKMAELVANLLSKNPAIREEAVRRVDAAKSVALEGLDELTGATA